MPAGTVIAGKGLDLGDGMKKLTGAVLAILLLGPVFATSGMAQDRDRDWRDRDWRDRHGGPGPDRYGDRRWGPPSGPVRRDFRRPPDAVRWRGGYWRHGWHENRLGWWWVVDGFWYFYPQPVYPYPAYAYVPPAVSAPPPGAPVAPVAPTAAWYNCANPPGYYPNVPACPGGWYATPATPPPG